MQKPIFITGATGSIGSELARRWSESGQAVRAMVRNPARAAALQSLPNVEIVPGDLSQPESLGGCLEGCSLVYHCAAKLSGSDKAAFQAINVTGAQALIDEAVRSGVERFIDISSIAVYGYCQAENITEELPWSKADLQYVSTKQEAERRVQAAGDKIPLVIARPGDVYGPGQSTWTIGFIQKLNQGILQPPTNKASGFLNPVYITNLIDALVLLGTHPAAVGQAFNVVDGTPIRVSDYIRRMARIAGKRVFPVPTFALRGAATLLMAADLLRGREASVTPAELEYLLHKSTFSNAKMRSMLGWKPAIDMEEGLRRTEEWLRKEGYLRAA
jgi:nucleoside-diphosphate-sugar epimerase